MRKVIFITIEITLFFLSGFYQSTAYLTIFFALLILFLIQFIKIHLIRYNLDISLEFEQTIMKKNQEIEGQIIITSPQYIFPHLTILLKHRYINNSQTINEVSHLSTITVLEDKIIIPFQFIPSYSGKVLFIVENLSFYDELKLFKKKISTNLKSYLIIHPNNYCLSINQLGTINLDNNNNQLKQYQDDEIENLRDYHQNDSFKHIHWKLSARKDELITKEFTTATKPEISFFIDTANNFNVQDMDAYIQLIAAATLGLLKHGNVIIQWFDYNNKKVVMHYLNSLKTYNDMILDCIEALSSQTSSNIVINKSLLSFWLSNQFILNINNQTIDFDKNNIISQITKKEIFL